jgi:hypothetical protein
MSLEEWKSFWEIGGIVLLFLTFVFGSGLVIVSGRISEVQKRETRTATESLDRFKLEAGQKISEAQRGAEDARTTAKGFESKIAESDARAKSAEAQVASAMARSDEAVSQVKTADARIAEAQRDAARANEAAEKERLARLQLEPVLRIGSSRQTNNVA